MINRTEAAYRRADSVVTRAAAIVLAGLVVWTKSIQPTDHQPQPPQPTAPAPAFVAITPSPITFAPVQEDQSECLAEALYYEARGEGTEGEKAVAEVVLQRTRDKNYPHTICGVVYEGAQPHARGCQFSFACDGALRKPKEPTTWMRVRHLADAIMSGAVRLAGETGHALYYHKVGIEPAWADTMVKTVQIGNHIFYRRDPHARERMQEAKAQLEPVVQTDAADVAQDAAVQPSQEVESEVETADAVGQGA
jgi:spore germination cell wall hydrolase CwlJ-like protein